MDNYWIWGWGPGRALAMGLGGRRSPASEPG
jgi:hypothetical protein